MTDSAWDTLLDRVDHVVAGHDERLDALESEIAGLLREAMADGIVDRELDPVDAARWTVRLLRTEATLHADDDRSLSTLRVILTRWLHPGRLD